MSAKQLTPLESLQRQKAHLQKQAGELEEVLEINLKYLQHNFVPLAGNSASNAILEKMPPGVQRLFSRETRKKRLPDKTGFSLSGLAEGALDMIPLFIKGPKGFITSFILKQIKKKLFR
ncbi:MAG: hypothetical protein LBN18_08305 [Dysgonamonadaceae bacterium]|jgi:hypothetical protein|nr:hypothetical protein [Dysgonamonadaceae bacterium]